MTFKYKGKDNLSVTGLGLAFSIVSTAMGIINGALNAQLRGFLGDYLASLVSLQFVQNLLIVLLVGFVTGSLLALVYNAFMKTKFASKY